VIHQSAEPVPVEQVQQYIALPFPKSAHDVRYAHYRDWQAVLELVRFKAPLEDCIAFANEVIHSHKSKGLRDIDPTRMDNPQLLLPNDVRPLSAPWFSPQVIRKGFVAGESESHTPRIWIDAERAEVYYMYTD
jgi:hypothetical protein